jgi:hypothetical protein
MASHTQLHAFSSGLTSQVMDQQTYWADQFLLRERFAPPITSLAVWRLTRCKRFGEPLLSFVTELLPKLAGQLTVKKGHPGTDFFALYYSSGCGEWWSMRELLTHMGIVVHNLGHQQDHFMTQVVWNTGLFSALITGILRDLVMEVKHRKAAGTL